MAAQSRLRSKSASLIETPRVFAPLWKQQARYKGAHGGRGSGKSHDRAAHVVVRMLAGDRVVCLREVQNSIKDSVKQLIEDKIRAFGLEAAFVITEQEIRGPRGSLCIFRGLQNHTAESIKSLEGFRVAWVEEAHTISDKSLTLLTPTIREAGAELWFTWNPRFETDPVDRLLRQNPPEGAVVIEANWNDNPYFPEDLRVDMERDRARDPERYQHIWNGAYETHSESRIFHNWRLGVITPPEGVRWWYGADWGFARDATAALRCCIIGHTLYVDAEVYEVGCPVDRTPALLHGLPEANKWPMRADSARPETIDYVKRHGFPQIRAAAKGKNSVFDGIEFLRGFDIVVNPACTHLERELALYAYKTDKQTGDILPDVEDANNHLIDALRYAVEGLHRRGKMIVGQPEPRPVVRNDYGAGRDAAARGSWKVL